MTWIFVSNIFFKVADKIQHQKQNNLEMSARTINLTLAKSKKKLLA